MFFWSKTLTLSDDHSAQACDWRQVCCSQAVIRLLGDAYGRQSGLRLSRSGIGYADRYFEVTIPWYALQVLSPVEIDRAGLLRLNLRSVVAGCGYTVHRFSNTTDDDHGESPLQLVGTAFMLQASTAVTTPTLAALLLACYRGYAKGIGRNMVNRPLERPGTPLLREGPLDNTVLFRETEELRFPNFCPITGKDCSECVLLPCDGQGRSVSWLVSPEGQVRLRKAATMRRLAVVGPLGAYLVLAVAVLVMAENSFPWLPAVAGLPVFGLTGWLWRRSADAVQLSLAADGEIAASFADTEYRDSFVAANSPVKMDSDLNDESLE